MIKLIVSDLDGTFLADNEKIHPDNLAAIQHAAEMGIHFAVASGRMAASCSILMRRHGIESAHILAGNGCHIVDGPFGHTLETHYMDREAAANVMRIITSHNLEGCLCCENTLVYTSESVLAETHPVCRSEEEDDLLRRAGLYTTIQVGKEAISKALETEVFKLLCIVRPGQERAFSAARQAVMEVEGVTVTSSWMNNFEVMPAGVDKGTALQSLASRLHVTREEILAFGDSDNDLPMLRWAGHSYAMANADPDVIREIGRTTGSNDQGGVARMVNEYLR